MFQQISAIYCLASNSDHGLFGLSFSAILIVVSLVAILDTFLVPDRFHLGLLIQVPCDCILLGIIARVAISSSIAVVVIARIKTSFLFLSSISNSVAVRVVCLG